MGSFATGAFPRFAARARLQTRRIRIATFLLALVWQPFPPPPLFFNSRPLRDFERAKNFLVENREIENGKGAGIILLTILSLSPSLIPFFARFFRLRGILMREGENYSRSFSRHRRFSEQLTFVDLERDPPYTFGWDDRSFEKGFSLKNVILKKTTSKFVY